MSKSWREHFIPIIAAVLREHPADGQERRKALREAWPASERAHHPYKIWLDEISRQTGRKPPLRIRPNKGTVPGQGRLF